MKRNYPYTFHHAPNPENFGKLNHPVPVTTSITPTPIKHYQPKVAPVSHPMWNENTYFINTLEKMFRVNGYDPINGYSIDSDGLIYAPTTGEEATAGVISAMAIGVDTTKNDDRLTTGSTHIINTEDYGLRYVCPTKDGRMLDLGPVEHACIVGNNTRPEGIYVPICNTKAMADGITMLKEFFNKATEDDRDLIPFEDCEKLPAPDYNKHEHKCSCGGNCKSKTNKK